MNVFQLLIPKQEITYLVDNMAFRAAIDQLRTSGYTAVPVIREDGTYAGSVSEGDFLWALLEGKEKEASGQPMMIKNIMRADRNPAVKIDVELHLLFSEALNQNFVPVVDDRNMFIGIVTRKQVIQYFIEKEGHV